MDRVQFDVAAAELIAVGKRLYAGGMTAGNSGNISTRVGADKVLITPTGVCKGDLTAEMLVLVDMDGRILSGVLKPTSELEMHLAVYRKNAAARAVVHTHSPYAAAFALAGESWAKYRLAEITERLGEIPLLAYAPPGSKKLAEQVADIADEYLGALLAEHGPVVWGESLKEAVYNIEELEAACKVILLSKLLKSR